MYPSQLPQPYKFLEHELAVNKYSPLLYWGTQRIFFRKVECLCFCDLINLSRNHAQTQTVRIGRAAEVPF